MTQVVYKLVLLIKGKSLVSFISNSTTTICIYIFFKKNYHLIGLRN